MMITSTRLVDVNKVVMATEMQDALANYAN